MAYHPIQKIYNIAQRAVPLLWLLPSPLKIVLESPYCIDKKGKFMWRAAKHTAWCTN